MLPEPENLASVSSPSVQIAHVLFLDIVGFSKVSTTTQAKLLDALNQSVTAAPTFATAKAQNAVQPLPTGDGMILLFDGDVTAPARAAREIARALQSLPGSQLDVRMGIHSGLVQKQMDIAGSENRVGEGINTAQRVMDFGDSGHILLSSQYAAWLKQFDEWSPLVLSIGEGIAKHGQSVALFSLVGDDFGQKNVPIRLNSVATTATANAPFGYKLGTSAAGGQKIALLYRKNAQPDEKLLDFMEERLRADGHEVWIDRGRKMDVTWARETEEKVRAADAVVAIVSPRSMQSELLEYELEIAHDQQTKTGKPLILPVRLGLPSAENESVGPISGIIAPLNQFRWGDSGDDHRLVAELISAIREPLNPPAHEIRLEPVGGAVPPDSPFYITRDEDGEMERALAQRESILLIKGARQMGKTSLQARAAQQARKAGWHVGLTDFQKLSAAQMESDERFYRLLAATLARQLKFKYDFENEWDDLFGANLNMETFLRELLDASDTPLVWCMDEVDKLFTAPFAGDFFGLVRSWHNSRSTEPDGPWNKLTVVIAYATEAHLFIQDLNQSPFNVGRRLDLENFNIQQVLELNKLYGGPLKSYQEAEGLQKLIGGQPFLSRRALDALATGKWDYAGLLQSAIRDDGPFSDHLKRILISVSRLPEVTDFVRALLRGTASPAQNQSAYYRLLASGVIWQQSDGQLGFRCDLYHRYLGEHLNDLSTE